MPRQDDGVLKGLSHPLSQLTQQQQAQLLAQLAKLEDQVSAGGGGGSSVTHQQLAKPKKTTSLSLQSNNSNSNGWQGKHKLRVLALLQIKLRQYPTWAHVCPIIRDPY
jgi:hypothetical protein